MRGGGLIRTCIFPIVKPSSQMTDHAQLTSAPASSAARLVRHAVVPLTTAAAARASVCSMRLLMGSSTAVYEEANPYWPDDWNGL
jgi:hypothetical protein